MKLHESVESFLEPFELTSKLESDLKKYGYESDIEMLTPEENDKHSLERGAKIREEVAKKLDKTEKLFLSYKYGSERIENAEASVKASTEDLIKKIAGDKANNFEVTVTSVTQDRHVGDDAGALHVSINYGGEEEFLEPAAFYYSGAAEASAESVQSWNWHFWLYDYDSPLSSDEYREAYEYDQISIALDQFAATWKESDYESEVDAVVKEFLDKGEDMEYPPGEQRNMQYLNNSEKKEPGKTEEAITERHDKGFIENFPDLAEKLHNAIEDVKGDLERDPASGGYETSGEIEEVEHKSRDGFISSNDGGYSYAGFVPLEHLFGSGSFGQMTNGAQKHVQGIYDQGLEMALDAFKEKYAKEIDGIPEDKLNYNDLYDMKKGDLAERLSELEMEMNADDTVMFLIRAFMEDDSDREQGITWSIQSAINWETPYHRPGSNNEDYKEVFIEFKDQEDMKKNFNKVLKAVKKCGQFLFGKGLAGKSEENESAMERIVEAKKKTKKTSSKLPVDFKEKMEDLAKKSGLQWDGGDDTRLFSDEEHIWVYANLLTKEQYDKMESEISKSVIKGKGYDVYAWNDVSGYNYWKEEGDAGDSNYIQVTVDVDPSKIDSINPEQLRKDADKLFSALVHWDNIEEWHAWRMDQEEKKNEDKFVAEANGKKYGYILKESIDDEHDKIVEDLVAEFGKGKSEEDIAELRTEISDSLDFSTGRYTDSGEGASFTADGVEYNLIKDADEAERIAKASLVDLFSSDPGSIGENLASQFLYISDTDRRVIGADDASARAEDLRYDLGKENFEEVFDQTDKYKEEYEALQEKLDAEEDSDKQDEIKEEIVKLAEKSIEEWESDYSDEVEEALKDPVHYLVKDQGIYSMEDLMKASFIQIDYEEMAQYVIDSDGWASTISMYDGNYDETKNGYVYFRE